jgi:hypothetical protein
MNTQVTIQHDRPASRWSKTFRCRFAGIGLLCAWACGCSPTVEDATWKADTERVQPSPESSISWVDSDGATGDTTSEDEVPTGEASVASELDEVGLSGLAPLPGEGTLEYFERIKGPLDPWIVSIIKDMEATPGFRTRTTNFLDRVKYRVSADKLREWAIGCITEPTPTEGPGGCFLAPSRVPGFVRELDPPHAPVVIVAPNPREATLKPYVQLVWGGGWGKWGLIVGSPDFRPPPDWFYVEWEPGIYAWHTQR